MNVGFFFGIWRERERFVTCTMAMCKRTPLNPTAMEAAAMTAGPVRNLTAIAKAAMEFPHAMILGCNAMNKPAIITTHHKKLREDVSSETDRDVSAELFIH